MTAAAAAVAGSFFVFPRKSASFPSLVLSPSLATDAQAVVPNRKERKEEIKCECLSFHLIVHQREARDHQRRDRAGVLCGGERLIPQTEYRLTGSQRRDGTRRAAAVQAVHMEHRYLRVALESRARGRDIVTGE